MPFALYHLLFAIALALAGAAQAPAGKPQAPFKTPLRPEEMANKQAVVNTTAGTFVIDLGRTSRRITSATS